MSNTVNYCRMNFEASDSCVMVCRDNHEKGQPCEYEELSPFEVLGILNEMCSRLLKAEVLLNKIQQQDNGPGDNTE